VNAKARKPASKKPAPAQKAGKTGATPKAVAKKIVKKPVPVKSAAKPAAKPTKPAVKKPVAKQAAVKAPLKKPVVAKPAVKKAVPQKAAPKKAAPSKVLAKPVAKKAVKAAPAKPVPTKKATPAKAQAGKTAVKAAAPKKPLAKPVVKAPTKTPAKTPAKTTAKAPVKAPAKPVASPAAAVKQPKATKVKAAKVVAAPAPVVHVVPIIPGYTPVVHKKNSRAAKMAALVPPPPAAVVVTNAAKSSFMPMTAPSVPSIVPVIPQKDAKLANNWKTKTADQLTDAEVIAMPDSEYMNDIQMAFFRIKLSKLKDEVLTNASETTEHLREDTVVTPDPADRATIEEEHALELRTRDRERKLLKKIEQSIHRIDGGDYGYCDETGEAIGVGRLLARPTATLSLEAQERRELKQKMFGD
jgi:DnaK suppressor protein